MYTLEQPHETLAALALGPAVSMARKTER
jgi:hypothetical protein